MVKIAYTDRGVLMGDFEENIDGSWRVSNPVFVNIGANQVALVPFLSIVEESSVTLQPSDIHFGGVFTPVIELRNQYSTAFGSGIQLATTSIR